MCGCSYSPNWFYYWSQTDAHWPYAEIYYNPQFVLGSPPIYGTIGRTAFVAGEWRCYMGDMANDSSSIADGLDKGQVFSGIDLFAQVWRHEARHRTVYNTWWPNGYNPSNPTDVDFDDLPDAVEPALSGAENGGPYVVGYQDTDGDNLNDGHDYVFWTQARWTRGNADHQDWSNNGQHFYSY